MRRRLVLLLSAAFLLLAATGAVADDGHGHGKGKPEEKDGPGQGEQDGAPASGDDRAGDDGRQGHAKDKEKDGEKEKDHGGHKGKGRRSDDTEDAPEHGRDPAAGPSYPSVPAVLTGDAALTQSTRIEPGRLLYVLTVADLGPVTVHDVRLTADLPDLGSAWKLSGPAAGHCAVSALRLACDFGDLLPAEAEVLQLAAPVHEAPAWEVQTTSTVAASNDAHAGNDEATSTVGILLT